MNYPLYDGSLFLVINRRVFDMSETNSNNTVSAPVRQVSLVELKLRYIDFFMKKGIDVSEGNLTEIDMSDLDLKVLNNILNSAQKARERQHLYPRDRATIIRLKEKYNMLSEDGAKAYVNFKLFGAEPEQPIKPSTHQELLVSENLPNNLFMNTSH